jgi:hypothetical protein
MTYGDFHRREMQMTIERQDAEWRRLNIKRKGYLRAFWDEHSEWVGIGLWVVAGLFFFALTWIAVDAAEGLLR